MHRYICTYIYAYAEGVNLKADDLGRTIGFCEAHLEYHTRSRRNEQDAFAPNNSGVGGGLNGRF